MDHLSGLVFRRPQATLTADLWSIFAPPFSYVLSNIGSFGEGIYKIGMTRRLEPLERVYELGDASVPFRFDAHAVIYSDNAPKLENDLHEELTCLPCFGPADA